MEVRYIEDFVIIRYIEVPGTNKTTRDELEQNI